MYVFMYCTYSCTYLCTYSCTYSCTVHIYVRIHVRIHVLYVFMYLFMYVSMYVLYVFMYVFMYCTYSCFSCKAMYMFCSLLFFEDYRLPSLALFGWLLRCLPSSLLHLSSECHSSSIKYTSVCMYVLFSIL